MVINKNVLVAGLLCLPVLSVFGQDQGQKTSDVTFDTAPGTVSAMSILGVGADDTTIVKNPRDFTVLLKTFEGEDSLGLSVTPARTSLLPLSISNYAKSYINGGGFLTRAWANFAISYAQGQAEVGEIKVKRRAVAVETSFYWDAKDDPLMAYASLLKEAKGSCLLIPPTQPVPDGGAELTEDVDLAQVTSGRARECRDIAQKSIRWNASRSWASVSTGEYKNPVSGSRSSLGRTLVLGSTYGFDSKGKNVGGTISLAATRANGVPTMQSLAASEPERQSDTLVFAQLALGANSLRFLAQGTNVKDDSTTVASRVFKRALGLDLRVQEGMWLLIRSGSQKRINGSGEERVTSFSLNFSPTMDLKFF